MIKFLRLSFTRDTTLLLTMGFLPSPQALSRAVSLKASPTFTCGIDRSKVGLMSANLRRLSPHLQSVSRQKIVCDRLPVPEDRPHQRTGPRVLEPQRRRLHLGQVTIEWMIAQVGKNGIHVVLRQAVCVKEVDIDAILSNKVRCQSTQTLT